jgi:hypothetical protein
MFNTLVRRKSHSRLLIICLAVVYGIACKAHAESLDALSNHELSLSNGQLTYSNFTANLSVTPADFGGPNPNSSYSYSISPTLRDVNVAATSTGLHIAGLNIFGFTNGLPEVTLGLSYLVSTLAGDIPSMMAGVPMQQGASASNSDHRLTATTPAGVRFSTEAGDLCRFVACSPGPIPLNVPFVSIAEVVHYNARGGCRLGPPTRDNVPGCAVSLAFDVDTTFTAVPEPSTALLLSSGWLALWLSKRQFMP